MNLGQLNYTKTNQICLMSYMIWIKDGILPMTGCQANRKIKDVLPRLELRTTEKLGFNPSYPIISLYKLCRLNIVIIGDQVVSEQSGSLTFATHDSSSIIYWYNYDWSSSGLIIVLCNVMNKIITISYWVRNIWNFYHCETFSSHIVQSAVVESHMSSSSDIN